MDLTAETITKLREILAANGDVHKLEDGRQLVVVPNGYDLAQIKPIDPTLPENIQQSVKVHDEASFLKYLELFKTPVTQIFAAPGFLANGSPYFGAAIDYHGPDKPMRNQHSLTYRPRYSDQWKLWMNTSAMNQEAFAEFIEENRQDVVEPKAAALLDLARNFKATRKVQYDKAFIEKDGNVKLTYSDETEAQGEVSVPDQITIGIPVYFGGQPYSINLWVRYRVGNSNVSFNLKPDRADLTEQHAFKEMATRIEETTAVPVYLGATEGARSTEDY